MDVNKYVQLLMVLQFRDEFCEIYTKMFYEKVYV